MGNTVSSQNWLILGQEKTLPIAKTANCETKQTLECGQKEKIFFKYNYFQLFFSNLRWTVKIRKII